MRGSPVGEHSQKPKRTPSRDPKRPGLRKRAGAKRSLVMRADLHALHPATDAAEHRAHRTTLANGLRIISVPQPHLHTATITMFVKVGSRHESPRDNGLSHLLEHMLFRGCQRYPSAYALNRAIEELGGTLHAATHSDSTLFEVTLPPSNAERGIAILGALFEHPNFSDLAIEKRIVREEILEYVDEDGREVDPDNLSRQLMFGAHPLGMTISGGTDNLKRFDKADLRAHMQRHYVADNMVLCVAGAVEPSAVGRAAAKNFSGLRSGSPTRAHAPGPQPKHTQLHYLQSQGSQTDMRLSFLTFGSSDPRYVALELLTRVLDDGMSTRLHRRICEELGLAYEVFATLEPYEECGVLDVGGAVKHGNAPVFVRQTLGLLAQFADKAVSRAELDKAKHRYKWQLEAILDDAQAMCMHYGQRALLGQDGDLATLRAGVDKVTQNDVREVAREVFCRERLHMVAVGMLGREQQRGLRRAFLALPLARTVPRVRGKTGLALKSA